ncbi:MAG: hypothetical protein QM579_10190 [Desulfovibrio sp.]|uniref:hypothetical protein n=1 Tax=Desulfovibrio sp. TaxID=885 RepID=UPI0039E6C742
MKGRWLLANRDFLVRDLVRDYCTVFQSLSAQRQRFEQAGAVSYSALRDLLGEAMRKGVFWRLKDTSHLLFRNAPAHSDIAPVDTPGPTFQTEAQGLPPQGSGEYSSGSATDSAESEQIEALLRHANNLLPGGTAGQHALEALIDWSIGYAFHECVKLREDAFQNQHYANRLAQIARHDAVTADMYNPLRGLVGQTAESSSRELSRISHVLSHGLRMLAQYLAVEKHNTHLARWLASEEHLAQQAFGANYVTLLDALYGPEHERLYLLAARDFLEAGRREPAMALLEGAHERGLLRCEGHDLLRRLHAEAGVQGSGTDICAACGKREGFPCLPYLHPLETH